MNGDPEFEARTYRLSIALICTAALLGAVLLIAALVVGV